MKQRILALRLEMAEFVRAWWRFFFKRTYKWFAKLEAVKDVFARGMYRQRGRFSRPFIHLGLIGLAAMAVTLAPVLAESFPGISNSAEQDQAPSSVVREVTDDGTTTQVSDKVREKVEEYTVQPGDTLSSIATKFGIDVDTIKWENDLDDKGTIKPGLVMRILPVVGVAHKVTRGETVYSIAKKYATDAQAIADFPFNTFEDEETFGLNVGQVLIVPEGSKPVPQTTPRPVFVARTPDAGAVTATGQFGWPIFGAVITQRWSSYHPAWDIASPALPDIHASDAGVVIHSGWSTNGYGNMVMVDHQNGYVTLYGHFSKLYVKVGQRVNRGDALGREGSTGRSTGPHVHFEIRRGNVRLNPGSFLK